MQLTRRLRMLALVATATFGALGCKQGIDQPCEVNSDCASNFCCGANLSSAEMYRRGLCQAEGTSCVSTPDAGPRPDGGPLDAGARDAGPADAGPVDGGPADGGPPDAGPADAGTDAGAVAGDAGTDAGTVDAGT